MNVALRAGDVRAVLSPGDGGRLASLVVRGRERIVARRPAAPGEPDTLWGCFVMAPWAGRVAHARLEWDGEVHALPRNLGRHSIHGVVYDVPWTVDDAGPAAASLSVPLAPERWPLGGRVSARYELTETSLELRAALSAGERAMPAALGWHPWFARPPAGDVAVTVDAATVLVTDDELVPTGARAAVDAVTDLRRGPALGERRLDHVYADARSPAVVAWPDLVLELRFEPPLETIVVHTPPAGVCVEPQSAWPNAPALDAAGVAGTGLRRLEPGERVEARVAWAWRPV